jgi:SAM-dependent methyltransferase
MPVFDGQEGRRAFGSDPASYDSGRPDYPQQVYQTLQQRCGLTPGMRTLEIGPGPGNSTRNLIHLGAGPMVLVEPDERLVRHLARSFPAAELKLDIKIVPTTFERARLFSGWFDLAVAASSLHWLKERAALRKIARALRPGGWWAAWWNIYGDRSRPDEFFSATQDLLGSVMNSHPDAVRGRLPFALDTDARLESLRAVGHFDNIACDSIRWTLSLTTAQTVDLYATFSPILRLPRQQRQPLLDGLARICEDRFGGRVKQPVITPLYTARKA